LAPIIPGDPLISTPSFLSSFSGLEKLEFMVTKKVFFKEFNTWSGQLRDVTTSTINHHHRTDGSGIPILCFPENNIIKSI
jgi:hypothetical protein